jgi:ABC-2 type transport system permease protein
MTATTERAPTQHPLSPSIPGILSSEWTKIRSVRSTYWTILITLVLGAGLAVLIAFGSIGKNGGAFDSDFDPTASSLTGLFFGQLSIGVLAVMSITSEYSTGMIRTTLWAVPRRRVLVLCKIAVIAVVAFVVGILTSFIGFFAAYPIYSTKHVEAHIGDPHVLRALIGGGLFLALIAVLAFGIGALVRSTPAGITTLIGLMFVLPIITAFLPHNWRDHIVRYEPDEAGSQIVMVRHSSDDLTAWHGYGVGWIYAVIVVIAVLALINRRDA